ncbi:CU044_5270 family protein [Arthrobacter citreus]|uniref:CU044_5270 family protein n=1 Tax=Arthrobacter citreus TaxID=1670 RepID=UPI0037F54063
MDDLQLLRTTRNDRGTVAPAVLARGRERLMKAAAAETSYGKHPGGSTARTRRPWRRALLATAAAAAVAAAFVVVDVAGPGDRPGATAEAAQVLSTAAETTIQTADLVPAPGQYLKIQSTNIWSSMADTEEGQFEWLDTEYSTIYIPANREEEWVWERSGRIPTTFFNESSRQYASGMPREEAYVLRGNNGAFYDSDPAQSSFPSEDALAAYPRNPGELLSEIRRQTEGQGQSEDGQALVFIADLLRTGMVPADLRAALYQAAALIPGVTITEEQATLNGKRGIAIGRVETASNQRQDIIIDPATGLLIGERQVLMEPQGSIPAGTATTWTAIETTISETAP